MHDPDAPAAELSPTERRRRARTAEILRATRRIFDEKGIRVPLIDELATSVGVNRAIIYRHFSSKDEIFAYTLVGYLDDLHSRLVEIDEAACAGGSSPRERLAGLCDAFFDFGLAHPAFVDSAQTLMMQTADELQDGVDGRAALSLGAAMARAFEPLIVVLRAGVDDGTFACPDPAATANLMYAQGLGSLALARVGAKVYTDDDGLIRLDELPEQTVRQHTQITMAALADATISAR